MTEDTLLATLAYAKGKSVLEGRLRGLLKALAALRRRPNRGKKAEWPVFDLTPFGQAVLAEGSEEADFELRLDFACFEFGLIADIYGNWSWKPQRDKILGDRMITYKMAGPSFVADMADMPEKVEFQEQARLAHKIAGDYCYHA